MRFFALFLVGLVLAVTVEGKKDKTEKGNGDDHPVFGDGDDIEIEEGEDDATVTVDGKSHVVKKVKVEESDEGIAVK